MSGDNENYTECFPTGLTSSLSRTACNRH